MAKEVIERLVDDIDGSDAAETVEFALDGRLYTVDLNEKNADALREALAPFVEVGVPGPTVRAAVSGALQSIRQRRSTRGKAAASSNGDGPTPADVRTWARDQGFVVSDRGRIHRDVQAAYDAAH